MTFKLVVKDGATKYKYDPKTGYNKSKTVDRVEKFDDLTSALAEFLYYVGNEDERVSLVYVPNKGDK